MPEEEDELLAKVQELSKTGANITITALREKLSIGYSRASKLVRLFHASSGESTEQPQEKTADQEEATEEKYGKKKNSETNNLPCPLTNDELLQYGDESARLTARMQELDDQKKSVNAQIKQEQTQLEARIDLLSQRIRERREFRDIPCERVHDYDEGTVTLVRLDTGDDVSSRAMTGFELSERDSLFHKQEVDAQDDEDFDADDVDDSDDDDTGGDEE